MSLQDRAYRGAGWSGLSGLFSNGLELLKYVILARLLEASDFGLLAMAMVIIGISRIFADGGTSNAVIHFRNQDHQQLSTLFWINIMAGTGLYLLVLITAPLFAQFYEQPEVTTLLRLGGLVLPLFATGALYEVMLRKSLSFKIITISEGLGAVTGFVTAVVMAFWGWGVYALIWSQIVLSATMTLIYVVHGMKSWRPSFAFRPAKVISHLRFGIFQMGERGLNVYATRIDQLIIGRFFGPEILGAYHIAWQIILFPVMRLIPLLNRVALPVFSSRQDDDGILRNAYLKLMTGVITMLSPLFIIATLTAPWLVPVLFGDGWELTIRLIPLMAMLGFLKMLGNPSNNIVLSKGRADIMFYWNLVLAIINTAVFLIGAYHSIFVLLGLYAFITVFYFIVGHWIMVYQLIGLTWSRFFNHIIPCFVALGLPWGITWIFRNLISGVWSFDRLIAVPVMENLREVFRAWNDISLWYEHAMTGDIIALICVATLFLILYIPIARYFQSTLIMEALRALRPNT